MVPWIQVFSNMVNHPKTYKLADLLGIKSRQVKPNVIAGGLMVSLWTWAAQNATDGDLSGVTAQCIADAAGWVGSAAAYRNSLVTSGYADEVEGGLYLHDWLEHAALLMDAETNKKEKNRERAKRSRDRKKSPQERDESVTRHGDGRDEMTARHAPTQPNLTIPNQEDISILSCSIQERKEKLKETKEAGRDAESWEGKKAQAYGVLDKLYPGRGYGDV